MQRKGLRKSKFMLRLARKTFPLFFLPELDGKRQCRFASQRIHLKMKSKQFREFSLMFANSLWKSSKSSKASTSLKALKAQKLRKLNISVILAHF
jgi:hypothetical protein